MTKSVERKVESLNKFVKPAHPCRRIADRIGSLNREWARSVGTALSDHYTDALGSVLVFLRNADPSTDELSEARQTALRWGKRNYGHKLTQDTIREFGSQIPRIFHVNRGVPSGGGSQPVATAERFGRGTRWTPPDADGELFCPRAAGNANSWQPRKHSEQKLVRRDSRPSSNTRSWTPNSGRVAALSSLVGSSSDTRVRYRPSKEVRGNYRVAPYNINPNRRLNLGVIGDERDPANNMFECQVCCKDHPNVSFISGTQAIAYSRAVFLDQGATADAIFAADTAREILLISGGFPKLPDNYVRNEEGLQWEIFSWKFQNVPAFQRRLRESGDVSFTGSGGPTTRKQVNGYGKLLTAFRDQMLGEGARGLCYRSDMSTRTAVLYWGLTDHSGVATYARSFLYDMQFRNCSRLNNDAWQSACQAGVALYRPTHRSCRAGAHKHRWISLKRTGSNGSNLLTNLTIMWCQPSWHWLMLVLCATRLILLLIILWNMILILYVLLWRGYREIMLLPYLPSPLTATTSVIFRDEIDEAGGVGILFKTIFNLCSVTPLPAKIFECIEVVLRVRPTSTVRIVTIYRPPSSGKNTTPFSEFITEFNHVLDRAATRPTEYVIVGDFNMHYGDLRRPDVRDLSELLLDNEYTQHVTEPTHVGGNILDLVITRDTPDNIVAGVSVDTLISDHKIVQCNLLLVKPRRPRQKITYRKYVANKTILNLSLIWNNRHYLPTPVTRSLVCLVNTTQLSLG